MKNKNYFLVILLFFQISLIKTDDEDENPYYFVHFDLSDPDIVLVKDKNNPNPEIKDITEKLASHKIPTVNLDKEGYFFSGWTEDWIYGYEPGDIFHSESKNTTLFPVFGLLSDKTTYRLEYKVEFEGQNVNTKGTSLPKGNHCKNRIVTTSLLSFPQLTATQRGWTDGKNIFAQEAKMVMPDHNVTLYAMYYYYRNLTYTGGDVDGLVGLRYDIQVLRAGGVKDLAEGARINRKGYTNVCWHCENDGIDYPFFYQYIMPDEDVIMTAVWEPITYNVVFSLGISSVQNPKIRGQTDSYIVAPNVDEREGYTFDGWKIYENEVYIPGDEILVKGAMPGVGISAKAIWLPK